MVFFEKYIEKCDKMCVEGLNNLNLKFKNGCNNHIINHQCIMCLSKVMKNSDSIISVTCGSMALEGLVVPEEVCKMARDCLNGSMGFDDAISIIIAKYSESDDV